MSALWLPKIVVRGFRIVMPRSLARWCARSDSFGLVGNLTVMIPVFRLLVILKVSYMLFNILPQIHVSWTLFLKVLIMSHDSCIVGE